MGKEARALIRVPTAGIIPTSNFPHFPVSVVARVALVSRIVPIHDNQPVGPYSLIISMVCAQFWCDNRYRRRVHNAVLR